MKIDIKLKIILHTLLILGAIIIISPLVIALIASTHTAAELAGNFPLSIGNSFFSNYQTILGDPKTLHMMLNSMIMALGITIGKIIVSILAAFAIVYFRFPFRMFAFWLIFITLLLPVEVRIVPTFKVIASLEMLNSYAGLTIPLIASATATFLFRQFFLTIPDELLEASRIDGATPFRFFWDIVLPLSKTNIAALFVISFIYGWNQYLWPLVITTQEDMTTIILGISQMLNAGSGNIPEWNIIMGTALIAIIPPTLVVIFMQKYFVKSLVETEK